MNLVWQILFILMCLPLAQAYSFQGEDEVVPLHIEQKKIRSPLHIEYEEASYLVLDPNRYKIQVIFDFNDQVERPRGWYHHRVLADNKIITEFFTHHRPTKWLLVEIHNRIRTAMKNKDFIRIDRNRNFNEQRGGADIILGVVKIVPNRDPDKFVEEKRIEDRKATVLDIGLFR